MFSNLDWFKRGLWKFRLLNLNLLKHLIVGCHPHIDDIYHLKVNSYSLKVQEILMAFKLLYIAVHISDRNKLICWPWEACKTWLGPCPTFLRVSCRSLPAKLIGKGVVLWSQRWLKQLALALLWSSMISKALRRLLIERSRLILFCYGPRRSHMNWLLIGGVSCQSWCLLNEHWLLFRGVDCKSRAVIGSFLGIIIGWDPSACKSNRLHVDIPQFSFTKLRYIFL